MNRLRLKGDQNRLDELLKSVKGKDSILDFNKIIPMPESLNIEAGSRTEKVLKAYKDFIYVYTFAGTEQKYGAATWYDCYAKLCITVVMTSNLKCTVF